MKKQTGSDILEKILSELDMKAPTFAKNIGVGYMSINNIETGKTKSISQKIANAILQKYTQFSAAWILSGYGNMYNDNSYVPRHIETHPQYTVPLIPFDAIAGFGEFDNAGVRYDECQQYAVPEFERSGVEFVVKVHGSSMYPKYSNGDILACKKINDILFFQWGKVYVIDSSQGVLVKRIFEHENPDNILLVSDNKEKYPPFAIPRNDIRALCIVLGVIRME